MTPTATAPDFDALDGELDAKAAELETERRRLSLDALVSEPAARKLADVEVELAELERRRERVRLARAESARREAQAQADEAAQARAEGLTAARTLQARRAKAAARVDSAALEFARALREFDVITTEQEQQLRAAGWSSQAAMTARPKPWVIDNAVRFALLSAKVPAGMLRLEGPAVGNGLVPLVEGDPRVIDAAEGA